MTEASYWTTKAGWPPSQESHLQTKTPSQTTGIILLVPDMSFWSIVPFGVIKTIPGRDFLSALIPDKATLCALRQGWLISDYYRWREIGTSSSSTCLGSDWSTHLCTFLCWLWSQICTPSSASSETAVQQPRWDVPSGHIAWRKQPLCQVCSQATQ